MGYGQNGEILNTLKFEVTSPSYNWGPFLNGDGILPSGAYPVNQGTDNSSVWSFNINDINLYWPTSVIASSTHGLPNAGIENSNTAVEMINTEIYVKAQLFIVNTVTNTVGALLTIPITGLNTTGGATINVPSVIWQPLQATGQQHKIVLRAYVAHFKYRKGCWSGGNHAARVDESTYNDAELVPISPGTYDWEVGWVDNVGAPVVATWSTSQILSKTSDTTYYSSSISMNATLEAILPDHPVNGIATNIISEPGFRTLDDLKVNVNWVIVNIAAGYIHSLGLKSDGTVVAVGDNEYGQCNVGSWTNIIAVDGGYDHSLGLKSDGTVVATGYNGSGQCNVGSWTNIIAIAAGNFHSLGLRSDGTVVATGDNTYGQCNVGSWTNIIAVAAGGAAHSLGLKSDGTVVAVGGNDFGQCNVGGWTNIIAIDAGTWHSLGLKSDGTVVATGNNTYGQCNVGSWTNIIAVDGGYIHSLGLKSDGTVVATGENGYGQINVGSWTNIIAINASKFAHSLGLKSNGTVVATGYNSYGQCNVGSWDLIP